jgi:hypothetical protein
MKIQTTDGITTCELESDGAYSAFKMGMEDRRQWTRHPETAELNNYVVDKTKSEYIFVKYHDTVTRVR